MFLLDTGVAFELRKARAGRTDPGLASWAASVPRQSLFLSALSLIELGNSAARLEARDKAGAAALRSWIDGQLTRAFEDRILPVDAAVAKRRAQLAYADARDGLMAATALEHGLTLATRHTGAFRAGRVKVFNPWGYTPDADDDGDWGQAGRTGPLWLKSLFVRG